MKSRVNEIAAAIFNEKISAVSLSQGAALSLLQPEEGAGSLHRLYSMALKSLSHPLFLSPRELAEVSGIGEKQIRRLMKSEKLKIWRAPGSAQVKVTLLDLINAMEAMG